MGALLGARGPVVLVLRTALVGLQAQPGAGQSPAAARAAAVANG